MKLDDLILKTIREIGNVKSDWPGSLYESILSLPIDARGRVAERLVAAMLREKGCAVIYDENVKAEDKDYDLISDGIRIEIKFATRGFRPRRSSFQHENFRKTGYWDAVILVDIAPNTVYIVCEARQDLPWRSAGNRPWRKMHRRKESTAYKWDFTVAIHEKLGSEVTSIDEFFEKYKTMVARVEQLKKKGGRRGRSKNRR